MGTTLRVEFSLPLDKRAERELLHVLPDLVESVLILREAGYKHIDKALLSLLVGSPGLTADDVRRALAESETIRAVSRGTEWLTLNQLADRVSPEGSISKVRRWQRRRQLFSIRHRGADYIPRYALDEEFLPLRAVARVMKVLSEYSAYRLALWFERPSAALQGMRPREVIASAPKSVIAAAEKDAASDHAKTHRDDGSYSRPD